MKMCTRIGCITLAVLTVLILIMSTSCNDNRRHGGGCGLIQFPLPENFEFSWWYDYDNTYYTGDFTKLEDHPFMKDMELRTNVTVTFVEPTSADPKRELELLMASSDMTDLVTHNGYVPFRRDKNLNMLEEEMLYYELTEYIDVQMYNFNALRKQYVMLDKAMKTDIGNIYYIPKLKDLSDNGRKIQTEGLVLRKDLLDLANCGIPTTVEEWETVLRVLKALSVEIPLALDFNENGSFAQNVFLSAYGVNIGGYIKDTSPYYDCGATSDELYEYISLMNRWVNEGLLTVDAELTREDKLEEKKVGAWFSSADEMTVLNSSASSEKYELVGVADPVLYSGDKIELREWVSPLGTEEYDSVFISQTYDSPALVCKWLDEFFSEEIYERASYGIEGVNYLKDEKGNVTFTESVTNRYDGVCYGIAQNAFLEAFYCDPDVMINYGYGSEVKSAISEWSKSTFEKSTVDIHSCYTKEDMEKLHSTLNGQQKVASTVKNMILGKLPLEEWEDYCEVVKDDVEAYCQVKKTVYDRYLAS